MRIPNQRMSVTRNSFGIPAAPQRGITPSLCANEGECGPCINGREACCIGGRIVRLPCDGGGGGTCCTCTTTCNPPGCVHC
jgi:hypothetical protein